MAERRPPKIDVLRYPIDKTANMAGEVSDE